MPMKKTDLKVWVMNNKGYDTPHIMETEITAFQNLHPDVTIEFSVLSWSQAWQRIIAAVKSKQTPDIFQIGNTWIGTLAALHALLNIADRVSKDKFKEKFVSSTWASCESKVLEGVYAIPWFVDVRVLYYRKDALKKKGLSELCLSTWESFERTCGQINGLELEGGQIAALGVPVLKDQGLVHSVASWLWSAGGDFLSSDGKRATFHNREAFEGIRFYFNLIQKGYAPLPDKAFTGGTVADFFFLHKFYGFIFEGSWATSVYLPNFFDVSSSANKSSAKEEYGITLVPSGPAGRFTFCGGSNLAISNFSTHPDESWEFIKFLTSDESQLRHCEAIGMLPSVAEALGTLFKQETPDSKILKDSYQKFGRGYPQVPLWASIEMILADEFYNVIGLIKAKQYSEARLAERMNKAAERVNYLLSL